MVVKVLPQRAYKSSVKVTFFVISPSRTANSSGEHGWTG
jgi:hypothetical protein